MFMHLECFCLMFPRVRSKVLCGFQGWSGEAKGRHLAGFTAGAVSSVFHRLRGRTGKQAEKEVGGQTPHKGEEGAPGEWKHIFQVGNREGPAKSRAPHR